MAIYQLALQKGQDPLLAHKAIRHSMWLQKALEISIPASTWPIVEALIEDSWFEPIAALIAATKIYDERPDATQMLLRRLAERFPSSMDVSVLMKRLNNDRALDIRSSTPQTPILSENLRSLASIVRAERQFGRERRWLDEKLRQDAGHPLWLIRKEDDRKGGRIPLAISALKVAVKSLWKVGQPTP